MTHSVDFLVGSLAQLAGVPDMVTEVVGLIVIVKYNLNTM